MIKKYKKFILQKMFEFKTAPFSPMTIRICGTKCILSIKQHTCQENKKTQFAMQRGNAFSILSAGRERF